MHDTDHGAREGHCRSREVSDCLEDTGDFASDAAMPVDNFFDERKVRVMRKEVGSTLWILLVKARYINK